MAIQQVKIKSASELKKVLQENNLIYPHHISVGHKTYKIKGGEYITMSDNDIKDLAMYIDKDENVENLEKANNLEAENTNLKNQLKDKDIEIEAYKKQNEELAGEIQTLKTSKEFNEKENEDLKKENKKLKKENEDLKSSTKSN